MAQRKRLIYHTVGHDLKFLFGRHSCSIKAFGLKLKMTGSVLVGACAPVSASVNHRVPPGSMVDKKGQQEAQGYPLLTGCLWRAGEAAPESGLMVEMDSLFPCGVILFYGQSSPVIYGKRTDANEGGSGMHR